MLCLNCFPRVVFFVDAMWLLVVVLCVGLKCVIFVFPYHTHAFTKSVNHYWLSILMHGFISLPDATLFVKMCHSHKRRHMIRFRLQLFHSDLLVQLLF